MQVMAWLGMFYGAHEIPAFELNERTVPVLYALACHNEAADHDASLVVQDLEVKKAEYAHEGGCFVSVSRGVRLHDLRRKASR